MKKLFVLLIAMTLILVMATGAMAETMSLQAGIDGKAAMGPVQWNTTNVFLLDYKVPIDHWLVVLDYSTLNVKDGSNSLIWNCGFKGGYSFVDNTSARISATLGYYHQNIQNDILVGAVTVGLDGEVKLAKNLYLNAEIDCAAAGKNYQYSGVTHDLNSALRYKVNLDSMLTENFGLRLGYYYNEYNPKNAWQTSHNALTLGITSRF